MSIGKQTIGFQQITDLSSATALTVPASTRFAWIQCEGQNVRFRGDGTDPTASVGQQLFVNDPPVEMDGSALTSMKFIEETSGAKLNVHYFAQA